MSKKNLVATSLFGDGAGAVLVAGAETDSSGLDEGMQVLSPQLPAMVRVNLVLLRQRIRLEEMALAPNAAGRAMVGREA